MSFKTEIEKFAQADFISQKMKKYLLEIYNGKEAEVKKIWNENSEKVLFSYLMGNQMETIYALKTRIRLLVVVQFVLIALLAFVVYKTALPELF